MENPPWFVVPVALAVAVAKAKGQTYGFSAGLFSLLAAQRIDRFDRKRADPQATARLLDRIATDRVGEFLGDLKIRLRSEKSELLDRIAETGKLEEADEEELAAAIRDFVDDFGADFDEHGDPVMRNEEVLAVIAHPDFQTELGQFNLEINVPPKPTEPNPLIIVAFSIVAPAKNASSWAFGVSTVTLT